MPAADIHLKSSFVRGAVLRSSDPLSIVVLVISAHLRWSYSSDICSLGVVIFQLSYDLPPYNARVQKADLGARRLSESLSNGWDSDPLIDFLTNKMLVYKAERANVQRKIVTSLRLPDPSLQRGLTATAADENPATMVHQPAEDAVDHEHEEPFNSISSSEVQRSNIGHANFDASDSNASTVILETRKRSISPSASAMRVNRACRTGRWS